VLARLMFWPQVPSGALFLVPTGSYEQHGPHLPLDTDTRIAVAVADRASQALGDGTPVVVGPAIAYGASGEHQDFPGTVSVGTDALHQVLVELGRSACVWAARVVFVNGHGGNLTALRTATRLLRAEGRDVGWVPCAVSAGDAHAGYVETSVMLHLAPVDVDLARAVAGNLEPLQRLMPALVSAGVRSVSPSGVLGDPRGATAEAGRELLASIVDDVVARLRYGVADSDGLLWARAERRR
jgi:creatinine amidohydrolase